MKSGPLRLGPRKRRRLVTQHKGCVAVCPACGVWGFTPGPGELAGGSAGALWGHG